MFLKGSSSGICFCSGSNPCTSKDNHREELSWENCQSVEKDEHNLLKQEENIFDNEEDDVITVSC